MVGKAGKVSSGGEATFLGLHVSTRQEIIDSKSPAPPDGWCIWEEPSALGGARLSPSGRVFLQGVPASLPGPGTQGKPAGVQQCLRCASLTGESDDHLLTDARVGNTG